MSIRGTHFRELVVKPVLERMERYQPGINTLAAVELLVGTAAHESLLGRHLKQSPGPARGVYQIEPATFNDLLRWLDGRRRLLDALTEWASPALPFGAQIAGNLYFATAVARLNYWRKPFSLRPDFTIEGLAALWKQHWNTELGDGTIPQFLKHYRELAHT